MHEKLIEDWMDSATERQYQPIFCQALAAAGYTILHSTRHGPMELGKDVIARDVDGRIHAFQLKGNPGSRLTMSGWHAILGQIDALVRQPIDAPLVENPTYCIPTLVTNGDVDEEVQAAISLYNRPLGRRRNGPQRLKLVSRGKLLDDFIKPAAQLIVPTGFRFDANVFSLLAESGLGMLPIERFCEVVEQIFNWREANKRRATYKIHACTLMAILLLRPWADKQNHLARIFGYSIVLMHIASKCIQSRIPSASCHEIGKYMRDELFLAGRDLLYETAKLNGAFFYERSPLFEYAYHIQRLCLLQSVFSAIYLTRADAADLPPKLSDDLDRQEDFVVAFVREMPVQGLLVGEGQVPQLLMRYWFLGMRSGDVQPDIFLSTLLQLIVEANLNKDEARNLPSPYYDLEETIEHHVKVGAGLHSDLIARDSFRRQSWFAMSLFGLMVRRNWKQLAKRVFPDLSRLIHKTTEIGRTDEFCKFRSSLGREIGETVSFPARWDDYVERSKKRPIRICDYMQSNLLPLLVFLILCPYRSTERIVYWLDDRFLGSWHSKRSD